MKIWGLLVLGGLVSCSTPTPVRAPEPVTSLRFIESSVHFVPVGESLASVDSGGTLTIYGANGQLHCIVDGFALGAIGARDDSVVFVARDGRVLEASASDCQATSIGQSSAGVEDVLSWSAESAFFVGRTGLDVSLYSSDGQLAAPLPDAVYVSFHAYRDEVLWIDQTGCGKRWRIGGELEELGCEMRTAHFVGRQVIAWDGQALLKVAEDERESLCRASHAPLGTLEGELALAEGTRLLLVDAACEPQSSVKLPTRPIAVAEASEGAAFIQDITGAVRRVALRSE